MVMTDGHPFVAIAVAAVVVFFYALIRTECLEPELAQLDPNSKMYAFKSFILVMLTVFILFFLLAHVPAR